MPSVSSDGGRGGGPQIAAEGMADLMRSFQNIQLAYVISDISGATGLAILCDIVRGSGDPISWR